MAITLLQEYVKEFQERRKEVTDEMVTQFMTPRTLEWKGNPNPKPREKKTKEKESKETSAKEQAPKEPANSEAKS